MRTAGQSLVIPVPPGAGAGTRRIVPGGIEEYFGGASAAWGSKFNGNRNTSHWERTKLRSGDTVKVVITCFGTSGEVTDTEEVYLTAP